MKFGLTTSPIYDNLFKAIDKEFDSKFFKDNLWSPRLDIAESETDFKIEVELPGVRAEDIQLQFENEVLTISGSRSQINSENSTSIVKERYFGNFTRTIRLGSKVDSENISAKLNNGILNISIPKKDPPKKIDITIE